jgi:hypothetical protein
MILCQEAIPLLTVRRREVQLVQGDQGDKIQTSGPALLKGGKSGGRFPGLINRFCACRPVPGCGFAGAARQSNVPERA